MQQLFDDISKAISVIEPIPTDNENELTTTYVRLDDMKEIKVNRNKPMLLRSIAGLLQEDDIISVDLTNNRRHRSDTRNNDETILSVMYALNISMDIFAELIKESKIECWNKRIIDSGLTKSDVILMLSHCYDKKYSPCGKDYRSEDMQRVMSFYPYNIRFTDFSGYFEKVDDMINQYDELKETENIQEITHDQINQIFHDSLSFSDPSLGEVISIYISGYTRNDDLYVNIKVLEGMMVVKILFDKTLYSSNFTEYVKKEGSYCDKNNAWELHIPTDDTPFTKIIINWFKKQDIRTTIKTISVGNSNIYRYYYNIFKLLKNLSILTDDLNILPNNNNTPEYESKPDDWFNLPADGKYIPTGDSDIEDQGNGIDHYIYHNHCVNGIYQLNAGITNGRYEPHVRWNLCFDKHLYHCIDKFVPESIIESIIESHRKSQNNNMMPISLSFGEFVHVNDITLGIIDFLATNPIGTRHKHMIQALDDSWD